MGVDLQSLPMRSVYWLNVRPSQQNVLQSMASVPALPGGASDQYYQQDMGMGIQNEWNQGFSSDFLSLPQPQGSGNSGAHQFAFNNQWDIGSQPGFASSPMYGGQQFNDGKQYGNQQAFEGQHFGSQMNFNGQQYDNQQAYDGQQFGIQPGYGDMTAFEQQGFS